MLSAVKHFEFESAHFLPGYEGKCHKLHGHSWKLKVGVGFQKDQVCKDTGMILDFSILKDIVQKTIIEELDHKVLNSVVSFLPTCENLVLFYIKPLLEEQIKKYSCSLLMIKLWETSGSYIEWRDH